jgi:hypothetical protein
MLETITGLFTGGASTLLGGALGGILRVIPEVFKWLDRKDERKHELSMQDKALEFQKLKGNQVVDEIGAQGQADWDKGAMDALVTAIKGQDTPSGIKWVDSFSKLMRPVITLQWVVILYPAVIMAGFITLLYATTDPITFEKVAKTLPTIFGGDEKAIVAGIINFWFIDRVLSKNSKG